MRSRPELYVGEVRPKLVELYITTVYQTFELAYTGENLPSFRGWAGEALVGRRGTSLGSNSAGSYLEQHDPDLEGAVDVLFALHEEYIAEILGLELEECWLPCLLEPHAGLSEHPARTYLDASWNWVWGRRYTRPRDPCLPLHAAILVRSAEVRGRLGDYPLSPALIDIPEQLAQEVLRYSCFSAQDIEQIRALKNPELLAAAAFQSPSRTALLQEARRESDSELVLAALACEHLSKSWENPVEHWGLLDQLERLNPANGNPHVLRARLYLSMGLFKESWQALRRAARLPVWDSWDAKLRQSACQAAEAIGWPALESRLLVLGTGPFCRALHRLQMELRRLSPAPPSVLRALHQIALRQHRSGLAAERMMATALEKWTRSLLPSLAKTPEHDATFSLLIGPALEWLRALDAQSVSRERWVAYFDQVYADSELAAIQGLRADIMERPGAFNQEVRHGRQA